MRAGIGGMIKSSTYVVVGGSDPIAGCGQSKPPRVTVFTLSRPPWGGRFSKVDRSATRCRTTLAHFQKALDKISPDIFDTRAFSPVEQPLSLEKSAPPKGA